jgi:gliding motility-associated-like protein
MLLLLITHGVRQQQTQFRFLLPTWGASLSVRETPLFVSGDSVDLTVTGGTSYIWSHSLGSGATVSVSPATTTTYEVTATSGPCTGTAEVTVTVEPNADATINPHLPLCENDSGFYMTAVTPGGNWSGNGIDPGTGYFEPSAAGAGTHTIYYSISGMCGDEDSVEITVWPSPSSLVYSFDETCIGAGDGWAYAEITGGTIPYSLVWSNSAMTDTVTGLTPGSYELTVTDNNGCSAISLFNILAATEICTIPHVFIPNVFSPNGDGENDILYVRGDGIKNFEFIIYTRWGQKIFETTSQDIGWDGTFKGKTLESGVFVYFLKATFINNESYTESGSISLVR